MRRKHLPLALCLALGMLGVGPALAQDKTQDQTKTQDQDQTKPRLLERDHSAEEAKDSLQGRSQGHPDGHGSGPSSGHGSGPSPSHGGGPHR